MKYVQAEVAPGAWKLPQNDLWNIPPKGTGELRFLMEHGEGFHRPLIAIEALAITIDGKVFGNRRMHHPRESGYNQEGRVSVGGKKHRAFTSSRLFEREDGSLCDVAVFIVVSPKVERKDA